MKVYSPGYQMNDPPLVTWFMIMNTDHAVNAVVTIYQHYRIILQQG